MSGPAITLSKRQQTAVTAVEGAVLVSAAAGSGKTRVLTERVIALVSGALPPPNAALDIDRIVVVTFTEAAATEMRRRIADGLRRRLRDKPQDRRLQRQLALLDLAPISTIHSFCNRLLREYFADAGIDPAARVLDANEATLLRHAAVERLFADLYDDTSSRGDAFRALLSAYFLGDDAGLGQLVLSLHDFTRSVVDPEAWLDEAVLRVQPDGDRPSAALAAACRREIVHGLDALRAAMQQSVQWMQRCCPELAGYAEPLVQFLAQIDEWRDACGNGDDAMAVDAVRRAMLEYDPPRLTRAKDDENVEARERIKLLFTKHRDWFRKHVVDVWCKTDPALQADGLRRIAPHVAALADLVRAFERQYAADKAARNALDFSDLERRTLELLCKGNDVSRPSPVAQRLQETIAHVLVDEFQDINPVQDAILRLVSGADDATTPGRLFAVGDVKQSIYRFRLAEPQIFVDRLNAFVSGAERGRALFLPENYRSSRGVIDGVNRIFTRIMTPALGGVAYDENARLAFGERSGDEPTDRSPAVELHLLPRKLDPGDNTALRDALAHTEVADREAHAIARRISELVSNDGMRYGDIAILLRSIRNRGPQMARTLARAGIPVHVLAGGDIFKTLELRDVMSLLAVLDNPQQDIPLAAVLRSPLFAEPIDESELVHVVGGRRGRSLHESLVQYADKGENAALKQRLHDMLQSLQRWRRQSREQPISIFLWRVLETSGYLSALAGMADADQRRANLETLHAWAQQFEQHKPASLHAFVQALEDLAEQEQDIGESATPGEGDAVQIMSVHKSKGLEFPIVILADAGKQFNFDDARGRILYDRESFIAPRVVDEARMIEYPSIAHALAETRINHHTRAEELRLLYVALTRAEEKLIVVGSIESANVDEAATVFADADAGPLPEATLTAANGVMDWLLPALAAEGALKTNEVPPSPDVSHRFSITRYDEATVLSWLVDDTPATAPRAALDRLAALEPLPATEPIGDAADAARIIDRMAFRYHNNDLTGVPAVVAASELKHRVDVAEAALPPAEAAAAKTAIIAPVRPRFLHDAAPTGRDAAIRRGTLTHAVLEHINLSAVSDAASVRAEIDRIAASRRTALLPEDAALVDADAIAWFVDTPLGRRLRTAAGRFHRELLFVSREPAERYDLSFHSQQPADDLMIRGVIDGVLEEGDGLEIIDYKTDDVTEAAVQQRVARYQTQLKLYAAAAGAMFQKPVKAAWLVFLSPRRLEAVDIEDPPEEP